MKSPSLDVLYTQLDKHILLVQSYTEISELFFIIKACRLKPYHYMFQEKSGKLILYKWWYDEFGNSFKVQGSKRIELIHNDLTLPRKNITSTDLYYGLSIDKIVKISKLALICFGKDDDLQQDCLMVNLLGIDNYLRSFMYLYGEWQQVSPLMMGLAYLKKMSENRDIKYFKELKIKENSPIPCATPEQWLTFMPPRKEFMSLLSVHCQPAHALFEKREQ